MSTLPLSVTRTLYEHTYRCALSANDETIGFLRVLPGLPLDRSQLPEDAPDAPPFLLVIVDDADITEENLLEFEENVSNHLLERFATESFQPRYCQFFYPSPAFNFDNESSQKPPLS